MGKFNAEKEAFPGDILPIDTSLHAAQNKGAVVLMSQKRTIPVRNALH